MSNYRRFPMRGATYFFTVVSRNRQNILCDTAIRTALRNGIQRVRKNFPFAIDAWVLLPDHLHCIWTLPDEDGDFSRRWAMIKRFVTQKCGTAVAAVSASDKSRRARGEGGIWQRRFWEHQIRNERDYETHMHYIHYNPVKHGLVKNVRDWPYSTFHRYVENGIYEADWGGGEVEDGEGGFGE